MCMWWDRTKGRENLLIFAKVATFPEGEETLSVTDDLPCFFFWVAGYRWAYIMNWMGRSGQEDGSGPAVVCSILDIVN